MKNRPRRVCVNNMFVDMIPGAAVLYNVFFCEISGMTQTKTVAKHRCPW